jgi:mRNA interferase MazF
MMLEVGRGQVWMADLDPVRGHEQGRRRPVLIVSVDAFNQTPAGLIIIVPITGTIRPIPAHVRIEPPEGGLTKASVALCDQIRTISKARLSHCLGYVSGATQDSVGTVLKFLLGF